MTNTLSQRFKDGRYWFELDGRPITGKYPSLHDAEFEAMVQIGPELPDFLEGTEPDNLALARLQAAAAAWWQEAIYEHHHRRDYAVARGVKIAQNMRVANPNRHLLQKVAARYWLAAALAYHKEHWLEGAENERLAMDAERRFDVPDWPAEV